jgi:hypothetical protein
MFVINFLSIRIAKTPPETGGESLFMEVYDVRKESPRKEPSQ